MVKYKKPPTIAGLYPDLSPEELEAAEYTLKRYMLLVWRIYQRLVEEGRKAELLEALEEGKRKQTESDQ
jgi:hypothetical protein